MRFDKIKVIGKFWLHSVADKDTERHRGPKDEGRLIYARSQKRVYYGDDSDWVLLTPRYDVINQGAKMLMGFFPLPTGWNILNTNSGMAVMITNIGGDVGSTAGSWIISDTDQQGSHNDHVLSTPTRLVGLGGSDVYTNVGLYNHRHTIVVDGLHKHSFDGTWRPSFIKFCEAEYE